MVSSTLFTLLGLAAAAVAAPSQRRTLAIDDVVVFNRDGTSQIMKAAEFDALEKAAPAPVSIESFNATSEPGLVRRGCPKSTEIQVLSDETFLNWDVAISPVLSSQGDTAATIGVSKGYEIGNSVAIGSEITIGDEDIVSLNLGMDLDMSWSTSYESSLEFEIPANMFGVIVSQPYVRRVQGNILKGCTSSPTKTSFMADTYESQSYGQLSWVKGVIRVCSSETYPIPYCIGEGQHR
ncbi:hypothetical protein CCHL11_05165 [Colletotrichum chlorophyti]|uniref:Uncharacterized protein n=1 Tax=Colletotrichum chlorophyti TaxID=708187 RepID=A0A1Q8S248_9PEZI|nr:hypothetical protein CCHL11_05165 [Colletotrichum chlorophyti]